MNTTSFFESIPRKRPHLEAVVSILDDEHYEIVEALWKELDQDFGIRGVFLTPIPHFSYQVAESYDHEELAMTLQVFAKTQEPFIAYTSGLGLFTGPAPTLYIPVVRSLALTHFHENLWKATQGLANGLIPHYDPQSWFPHITLTQDDADAETIGEIFTRLCHREFNWRIPIDNVALICDMCGEQGIAHRYPLSGPSQ